MSALENRAIHTSVNYNTEDMKRHEDDEEKVLRNMNEKCKGDVRKYFFHIYSTNT